MFFPVKTQKHDCGLPVISPHTRSHIALREDESNKVRCVL